MPFISADRIKETSTSTGTGPFTTSGPVTGSRSFSAVCSVGDTFFCAVHEVDGGGAPSGEWEIGVGTYSASNQVTMTTVISSSNSNSPVSFSAGTKHIFITMPAKQVSWIRERLTANRTYYVRTDGNDSNSGLSNDSGGAFLTIQKATDVVCGTLNLNGYDVTIQIADGTYTTPTVLKPIPDFGTVTIQGNNSTPSNVIISTTANRCFEGLFQMCNYTIKDLKVQTTTSHSCIVARYGAHISYGNIVFGNSAGHHIVCDQARIDCISDYSITGTADRHVSSQHCGTIFIVSKTVTITGSPSFTNFAAAEYGGVLNLSGNTYSGGATGARYFSGQNGLIISGTTLPGNSAGSVSQGGTYY